MKEPGPAHLRDPKTALFKGAIWAVAMRWSVKSIGLASTAILARFLQPQDYGIVAMAFLIVGLVDTFLNTGTAPALARLGPTATINQIDSAWTLRGLQGIAMALALAATAPFAAMYFSEPRVAPVLWVVGTCLGFMGFANIGMTLAYRDLQFSVEFKWMLYTKLASVVATLVSALYFGDYRALVSGIVVGFVVEWLLSYHLHPYRPRWCTENVKDIWDISKWLMVTGIGSFFLRRTDQLMAGRVGSTREYGLYTVGADIGQLPAGELGPTLTRPLFPILASMKHDWERAKTATLKTLGSVNTITVPLGLGLAAVSEQGTLLLLGPKWLEAAPFVAGFAVIGVVQYITEPLNTLLNVAGHVRVQSRIVWIEFLIFVMIALLLMPIYHLHGLMLARIASGLLQAVMMMFAARQFAQLSLKRTVSTLVRPIIGACFMYGLLVAWGNWFNHAMVDLIGKVIVGALFYIGWILITWHLARRPEGIESTVLGALKSKFRREHP